MCFQLPVVRLPRGRSWSCPLLLGLGQALSETDPEMRIHVHVIEPGEEGSGGIQPLQASGGVSWGLLQERTKMGWLTTAEIHSLTALGAFEVCWEGSAPVVSPSFGGAGQPGGSLAGAHVSPVSATTFMWPFPLCLCPSSYKDTFYWV